MDELTALVNEYRESAYNELMSAVAKDPAHIEDVGEMNGLFDAVIKAHHAARRYMYLYIDRAMEYYFEQGFKSGIGMMDELTRMSEEPKHTSIISVPHQRRRNP